MSGFQLIALVLSITALFAYLNERTLRLPIAIGVAAGGMITSLIVIAAANFGPWADVQVWAEHVLTRLSFNEIVLRGLLGVLLFAGALRVDLGDLRRLYAPISCSPPSACSSPPPSSPRPCGAQPGSPRPACPWSWPYSSAPCFSPTDPIGGAPPAPPGPRAP